MRYVLVLTALIIGVGVGYYFGYDIGYEKAVVLFEPKEEIAGAIIQKEWLTYRNDAPSFSIRYQAAPYGYVPMKADEPDALFALTFYDEREWLEFLQSSGAREGPRSIAILVFENEDNLTAKEWVERAPESNYSLSPDTSLETVTVNALEGVKYRWSGLYEAESAVFADDSYIYMLSGTYSDPNDRILADFRDMIATFSTVQ
jgi:hypothetical protein